MSIPIRNIYYLLLYAWDFLDERDQVSVAGLESTRVVELFGRLLASSVHRLIRRGIDRGYTSSTERIAGVRGRIELTPTLCRGLLAKGETVCTFEELTVDTLPNRIVKAAAEAILNVADLDETVASDLRECVGWLADVRSVPLTVQLCHQAQLHQGNHAYRLPISVAALVAANLLVDERTGDVSFASFDRDDGPLALLFQSFVRNFLAREQTIFRVDSPSIEWAGLSASAAASAFVPAMFTDVVLQRADSATVIETKYYKQPFAERFGKTKLRSQHLYQLFAYMANLARRGNRVNGVLLYAQAKDAQDFELSIDNHRVRVMTLDLSAEWPEIHSRLVSLGSWAAAA